MRLLFIFFALLFVGFSASAQGPVVSVPRPDTAVKGFAATFWSRAHTTDNSTVACRLGVDGQDVGGMAYNAAKDRWQTGHVFDALGTYRVQVWCEDAQGNTATSAPRHVTVSDPADRQTPQVSEVKRLAAVVGEPFVYEVDVSDNRGVVSCELVVGELRGPMMLSKRRDKASVEFTFREPGGFAVHARCRDAAWNSTNGSARTIAVFEKDKQINTGSLLKVSCGAERQENDPCTAVYVYGKDYKRHAFPNERVYKSWYEDFNNVKIISTAQMAAIPVGKNVTYHPAKVLLKFQSGRTAYAVNHKGVLHPVFNGDVAERMYGSNWTRYVYEMPDAFFSNYTIGTMLRDPSDFSPQKVIDRVESLIENF